MMQTLSYTGVFKPALLFDELAAVGIVPARLEGTPDNAEVRITVEDWVNEEAVAAVIDAHNADDLTAEEQHQQMARTAVESMREHLAALSHLSARDAAYALVARSYALAANEPWDVIDEITDRNAATAYLAGTAWWGALNSVQRQYKLLDLEAEAIRTQAMIALMR